MEVFTVFLRLGLTSFGGPVAHLGYFHKEFVDRRRWIGEGAYADIVALCQFLPGPASSQVGMVLGLGRAGLPGALAAWVGFTLPSAVVLVLFALGLAAIPGDMAEPALHGLKVMAVAIVAQALWGMAPKLCPDIPRVGMALLAAVLTAVWMTPLIQIMVIVGGGLLGAWLIRPVSPLPHAPILGKLPRGVALFCLIAFAGILLLSLFSAVFHQNHVWLMFERYFRAGALVFGGGHVVLPLLQAEVVGAGTISPDSFMAGYGAAQAVPGPLFTLSAYLGAASVVPPNGWTGAVLALVAIFLPSFLLVVGIMPFWEKLRALPALRRAMLGMNAAVVGLLLAAFYDPVWTHGIEGLLDLGVAGAGFAVLVWGRAPSWLVVLSGAVIYHLIG